MVGIKRFLAKKYQSECDNYDLPRRVEGRKCCPQVAGFSIPNTGDC